MTRKATNRGGRPRKPRHVADYHAAGDPPDDPLAAIAWAGKLLTVAMRKIATDPDMNEERRRQELRSTAKVLVGLAPAERLHAAEQAVRKHADMLDEETPDPGVKPIAKDKPSRSLRLNPR